MSCYECIEFEQKLAFHTAPTLLGIKSASLFSVSSEAFDVDAHIERFHTKAQSTGLQIKVLCNCRNRALILLYSEKLLTRQLAKQQQKAFLQRFGYDSTWTLEQYLERLGEHTSNRGEFPHEIGIFLGYPIEDVLGFIENKGDHFKLCGYWKVYGDAKKAQRTFETYTKCRNFLCNKLNQGNDIYQALRIS